MMLVHTHSVEHLVVRLHDLIYFTVSDILFDNSEGVEFSGSMEIGRSISDLFFGVRSGSEVSSPEVSW